MITSLPIWPSKANPESRRRSGSMNPLASGGQTRLDFTALLAAVPSDPARGEPERVRVVPVSVQFQHLGDDSFHGVLLGGHAGEVMQVLLALLNRVRRIGRVDALVP